MQKIISFFLLICLTTNVFASTGTVQALEAHLDEYQYALTVDWDQKDQKFYDTATEAFFQKMQVLITDGHLTKAEVLTMVEKKSANKNAVEALKLKFTLLSMQDSPKALAQAIKDSSKEMYSQGASWNGEVMIPLGIGLVIIAVLAYKWWWDANHKCVSWEERYDCSSSTWDDRSCSTVTDVDGYESEECDYYWQQEVTTTCGPMNFCTQYEKI